MHVVRKRLAPNGKVIVELRYQYRTKPMLHFIMTPDAGLTWAGKTIQNKVHQVNQLIVTSHLLPACAAFNFGILLLTFSCVLHNSNTNSFAFAPFPVYMVMFMYVMLIDLQLLQTSIIILIP